MSKAKLTDKDRIDYLQRAVGACLASDDQGFWAVSTSGMNSVSSNPPADWSATLFVEKEQWKKSVRAAIDRAIADERK